MPHAWHMSTAALTRSSMPSLTCASARSACVCWTWRRPCMGTWAPCLQPSAPRLKSQRCSRWPPKCEGTTWEEQKTWSWRIKTFGSVGWESIDGWSVLMGWTNGLCSMFVNNTHSLVWCTLLYSWMNCWNDVTLCVCICEFTFTDIYFLTLTRSKHAHRSFQANRRSVFSKNIQTDLNDAALRMNLLVLL